MKVTLEQATQTWRDDCATTSCNAVAFPCVMKEKQDSRCKYSLTTMFCGHCAAYCLAAKYWRESQTITPDSNMCVACMCAPAVLTKLDSDAPAEVELPPTKMFMVRGVHTLKV